MIIAVDGNEANVQNRVGVSVYTYNLLKYFQKKASGELSFRIYLRCQPLTDMPKENPYFKYEVVAGKFLWSQIFLPLALFSKKQLDVFFSPAHYLPRVCPVPTVVTIHDLSYLYFPEDFLKKDLYQLKNWTQSSISKATKVIAVSKTTKKDIEKAYGASQDKVIVVYNGYEKIHTSAEGKLRVNLSRNPYILYVGTLQPRKNVTFLIEAFSKIKSSYPDMKLVIAGKKGWLYEKIFEKVEDLGLDDEIYFTDFITDNQLIFLYKNAFCLVLPSLYEGFGIPILEAMSFRCPVVSSFTAALPEIGGDAALYFDPKNQADLIEKIRLIKENEKMRKDLVKKGLARIKEFSWESCGEKTLEIIKSAVKK